MEQTGFKVYGYRWIVLLSFMAIIAINQLFQTGSIATSILVLIVLMVLSPFLGTHLKEAQTLKV